MRRASVRPQVQVIPRRRTGDGVRTAVYCRVSTAQERASNSLHNQVSHYRQVISADPSRELVAIYHDYGLSGYHEERPGFQQMLQDAERDCFDLLVTKAITRLSRNTATVLDVTRRLSSLGIDIYFELQGIHTLSQEGELLLTLYAAFGQAESEGARQHTLMARQRAYERGEPPRQLQRSMGYMRLPDGGFCPDEYAPLVREVFELAAAGHGAAEIARMLTARGLTTHNGCTITRQTVAALVHNQAYRGDYLARATYVNEQRKQVPNHGEVAQYFFRDAHPALVSRELWEQAQVGLAGARQTLPPLEDVPPLTDEHYPYRHQVFCGLCGHRLARTLRAGRIRWECNGKERFSRDFCPGVSVDDAELRERWPWQGAVYVLPAQDEDERAGLAAAGAGASVGLAAADVGAAAGTAIALRFVSEAQWKASRHEKAHRNAVPALTQDNYPYLGRIFCKYCGTRLRRVVTDASKVLWVCERANRQGVSACKGVRVPDELLAPLRAPDGPLATEGPLYLGKEWIDGQQRYGYSRHPDPAPDRRHGRS